MWCPIWSKVWREDKFGESKALRVQSLESPQFGSPIWRVHSLDSPICCGRGDGEKKSLKRFHPTGSFCPATPVRSSSSSPSLVIAMHLFVKQVITCLVKDALCRFPQNSCTEYLVSNPSVMHSVSIAYLMIYDQTFCDDGNETTIRKVEINAF